MRDREVVAEVEDAPSSGLLALSIASVVAGEALSLLSLWPTER